MSWTDERVDLLKKLWQDGLSASQIAEELGGVSRNAVIGKVHSLDLSGRRQAWAELTPEERLLRAIFGGKAQTLWAGENMGSGFGGDQTLLSALDAISDSLEANVGRWNFELDLIEADLSRSMAPRDVEAAAL